MELGGDDFDCAIHRNFVGNNGRWCRGIFIFLIGAIFGAMIAGAVGGLALPIFTIFHRWLKKGEVIERNQFLPIAMGITFIICALILGLNVS